MRPEGGGQRPGSLPVRAITLATRRFIPGPEKRFCALRSGRYPPPEWNEVKEPTRAYLVLALSSGVRESGQELRKRQALYLFFSREGFPGKGSFGSRRETRPATLSSTLSPCNLSRAPSGADVPSKNSAAVWPAPAGFNNSPRIPRTRPGSGW